MRKFAASVLVGGVTLSFLSVGAFGQTSLTGSSLVLKSAGSTSTLGATGYLGTYLTVPTGGATINLNMTATGTGGHMNLVIADSKTGFTVSGTNGNYAANNLTLPAGTYLVRAERDYNNGTNSSVTVGNLSVATTNSVGGAQATFSNTSNATNALAAADTYINNFRKGNWDLDVQGIAPGTQVQVRLKNSAYKFGTAVSDTAASSYMNANPTPTSVAGIYQAALLKNFNSVTPENAGKWSASDGAVETNSDRMLNFAQRNGIRARQHNLIWGSQQPARVFNDSNPTDVNALFNKARSTDPAISGPAKAAIQAEINNRLATYVNGKNLQAGANGPVRATQYSELDVYNESYHTGSNALVTNANYWQVLGATPAEGAAIAADIYNRTKAATLAAGANVKVFTNEYNVLNNDANQYGQWYSQHIESIRKAGGTVDGIGAQWYASGPVGTGGSNVNPARAYATMANLGAQGLPIEITEFGTPAGATPDTLTTAMRLAFGSPDTTGFTIWGFLGTPSQYSQAKGSALYYFDPSVQGAVPQITAAGTAYEALHDSWTTNVTTTVNADGSITLPNGAFYGDYEITIKGQKYTRVFDKASNSYLLVVLRGDFNNDETRNGADIDALLAAQQGTIPAADRRFDVNQDGKVLTTIGAVGSDTDYLLHTTLSTEYGDSNLDGKVNFNDLVALAQHYNLTDVGWADGNFNGDGIVDFKDLVIIAQNYGFGAATAMAASFASDWAAAQAVAVPEPTVLVLPALLAMGAARRRRTT